MYSQQSEAVGNFLSPVPVVNAQPVAQNEEKKSKKGTSTTGKALKGFAKGAKFVGKKATKAATGAMSKGDKNKTADKGTPVQINNQGVVIVNAVPIDQTKEKSEQSTTTKALKGFAKGAKFVGKHAAKATGAAVNMGMEKMKGNPEKSNKQTVVLTPQPVAVINATPLTTYGPPPHHQMAHTQTQPPRGFAPAAIQNNETAELVEAAVAAKKKKAVKKKVKKAVKDGVKTAAWVGIYGAHVHHVMYHD